MILANKIVHCKLDCPVENKWFLKHFHFKEVLFWTVTFYYIYMYMYKTFQEGLLSGIKRRLLYWFTKSETCKRSTMEV